MSIWFSCVINTFNLLFIPEKSFLVRIATIATISSFLINSTWTLNEKEITFKIKKKKLFLVSIVLCKQASSVLICQNCSFLRLPVSICLNNNRNMKKFKRTLQVKFQSVGMLLQTTFLLQCAYENSLELKSKTYFKFIICVNAPRKFLISPSRRAPFSYNLSSNLLA